MQAIRLRLFLLMIGVGIGWTPSYADVYMKQKRHTDGFTMMGQTQPAEDVVEEFWITPTGFRSNSPGRSMVMLFDKKQIVMIDHAEKSYMQMSMDMGDMMSQMMGNAAGDEQNAAMTEAMQGMMKVQANVEATDETATINGWHCRKYIMTAQTFMGASTTEVWATEDIEFDTALYAKFRSAMSPGANPMQSMMGDLTEEWEKIKGIQVRSSTTQQVMNQSMTTFTELLEIKDVEAPGDLLDIPPGYQPKSF